LSDSAWRNCERQPFLRRAFCLEQALRGVGNLPGLLVFFAQTRQFDTQCGQLFLGATSNPANCLPNSKAHSASAAENRT
jgi:hypothetical protein